MTKVLIVDDEPALTRGLMRAILHRRPDYAVLTAGSGAEAVSLLEEQHIDLVITDLQMSDMDGFELLAWIVSKRPHVFSLAMTGYADAETDRRLHALGAIECFRKPVDIDALVVKMNEGLARNMRGHVHNVGLASFLQLLELEKKTCTLEVRSTDQVGKLYLQSGELIDATTGLLKGEDAACAIIGWTQVSIAIDSGIPGAERTIDKPAYYLVMEAMRVRDESLRPVEHESEAPSSWGPIFTDALPPSVSPTNSRPALDSFRIPVGALLLAVVDMATGAVLLGAGHDSPETTALVHDAALVLQQQRALLSNTSEKLEEVALLTGGRGELIKPIPKLDSFALLVFDVEKTNLVMARLELESFVLEYSAS